MMDTGDLHNFGKQVSLDHHENVFFKPRCVYWEHFYFGADSPLLSIFEKTLTPAQFVFFQDHFKLQIHSNNLAINGSSTKVDSVSLNDQINFRDVGRLIAYCSVFGLLDLHTGNLIYNGSQFIPIDIEVVNAVIRVPSETLLFPLNEEERPYSLYFLVLPFLNGERARMVLEGMLEMSSILATHSEEILREVAKNDFAKYPIRVIVRHTLDYRTKANTDLLNEENVQLERGDVPYFFKYLGGNDLFFYEEEMKPKKCGTLNERASKKFNMIGQPFSNLLSAERINSALMPNMLLQFLRYVQKDIGINKIESDLFSYSFAEGKLTLELNNQLFQTTALK